MDGERRTPTAIEAAAARKVRRCLPRKVTNALILHLVAEPSSPYPRSVTKGVVAFDLDGTLVPRTTVCIHLAPWVGHDALPALERQYDEGLITATEVAARDAVFYKGRPRREVWAQLEDPPLMRGIAETTSWLRERDLVPVIATVTWRFAAEFVRANHGFAAASGCEMEETQDQILLGTVAQHFDAEDKVRFVGEIAQDLGLGFNDIVAVGDSTSDIPLFREAGLAIALNASANAREAADIQLDTEDLRDLITVIEEYFSTRSRL